MGAQATLLTSFRALVEAVTDLAEHKGAVTESGMPSTAAKGTTAGFVVTMPATVPAGGRQRGDVIVTASIVVGLLIDVRQNNRPDAYGRAVDLEEAVLAATLGGPKVSGWNLTYLGTERTDEGGGAYIGVRMAYEATAGISTGAS
jgi:hypothetical protein